MNKAKTPQLVPILSAVLTDNGVVFYTQDEHGEIYYASRDDPNWVHMPQHPVRQKKEGEP